MEERVELEITALAAGGDGVGRGSDGRVVFVPFTAPGDRVSVRIVETRRRFARGRVETLHVPSSERTDPVCAVFGSCGGCAWQHLDYGAQLTAKVSILRDAMERIGGLSLPGSVAVHPSPEPYGYRMRARVQVEGGRVGFLRRRSHRLCETRRCPVLTGPLQQALTRLAGDRPTESGEWELSVGTDGGVRVLPPSARSAASPRIALAQGDDHIELSPGVFAQANAPLLPELVAQVVSAAAPSTGVGSRAVELFAGGGLFTPGLARRFDSVVAVEGDDRAVADLRRNLDRAGHGDVRVEHAPVEDYLAAHAGDAAPEVVLLDPPRAGLQAAACAGLTDLEPRRIVYLSCDPATLARDCQGLSRAGYEIARADVFDLFPQTPHVEALVVLERIGP